jgi:cytochrome c oxidase subunit 2
MQSALAPHGPVAEHIATLTWIMFVGGGAILTLVTVLAAMATFGMRGRSILSRRWVIVAGGIGFPVVILSVLLVYGLAIAARIAGTTNGDPLAIRVVGEQWWWRVEYRNSDGEVIFATANELRIPVGRPVALILEARDVIHSFWVPALAGKLDMIPGHVNRLRLQADRRGRFRGQCAEYCGGPHALMAFYVVAEPVDQFYEWYRRQERPAPDDAAPGRDVFFAAGCGACHAVRGTPASGTLGPDLTHVGGRISIGAGILPNNAGTLAGWIADAQHLKPENRMPSYTGLTGLELRQLAEWLETLR